MSFDPKDHIHPDFYGVSGRSDRFRHAYSWHEVGHVNLPNVVIECHILTIEYTVNKIREISGMESVEWKYIYNHSAGCPVVYIYADSEWILVDAVCRMAFVNYDGQLRCKLAKI